MSLLIQTTSTARTFNRVGLHAMGSRRPAVFASIVRRVVKRVATVQALRVRLEGITARRAVAQEVCFQAHVACMLTVHGVAADVEANTVHVGNPALVRAYARCDSDQWPQYPMAEVVAYLRTGMTDFFDAPRPVMCAPAFNAC